MDKVYYPEKPIVPFTEIVHDRIMMEIFRGGQQVDVGMCVPKSTPSSHWTHIAMSMVLTSTSSFLDGQRMNS